MWWWLTANSGYFKLPLKRVPPHAEYEAMIPARGE